MSLRIQNVSKSFKEFQALDDVTFEMNTGEIISILGPSGCGKSTLLQLIAGLQSPDKGEIILNDQRLSSPAYLMQPEKRPINMVFQDYALWPHMTVMQNIFYGDKLKKTKKTVIMEKKNFLFELLHLHGLEERYPSEISGGQKQRAAIARALATEPDLLLMDEPLSNLDMQLRYEMRNELSYLLRQLGTTVLHVTHDPLEAYALADRMLILRDGRIEQFGRPKEVRENPASLWVAGLLGMTNRLNGKAMEHYSVNEQSVSIGEQLIKGRGEVCPGSEAVIVLDSEDVTISHSNEHGSEGINCISGTVMHTVYEGRKWRLMVETAGGRMTVLHHEPLAIDSNIYLLFRIKDTLIFSHQIEKVREYHV